MQSPTSFSSSSSDESFTSMVSKQLPPDAKENFERASQKLSDFFADAKSYINENPREAMLIGVTIALGAWTLIQTAPGKKAYNAAGIAFMPRLKEWLDKIFNSPSSAVH